MVGPEVCAAVRTEPAVASGGGPTLCGRVRGPGSGPAIIQSDLVIHDEVHLLPAPVFRATARIQARRRLGLTATMIREDGAEPLVFRSWDRSATTPPGASSRTPAGSRAPSAPRCGCDSPARTR